jgi:hypothetical protein
VAGSGTGDVAVKVEVSGIDVHWKLPEGVVNAGSAKASYLRGQDLVADQPVSVAVAVAVLPQLGALTSPLEVVDEPSVAVSVNPLLSRTVKVPPAREIGMGAAVVDYALEQSSRAPGVEIAYRSVPAEFGEVLPGGTSCASGGHGTPAPAQRRVQ